MKIVVLVKYVPDTEEPRHLDPGTGVIDRSENGVIDEINARALAWALEARDAVGGEVVVATVGPEDASDALRRALAIGADSAVHVEDEALAGSDAVATSAVLAAVLRQVGFDLAVAGEASTDGQVGALPAMIAERLGVPHLTYLQEAAVTADSVTGKRDAGDVVYEVAAGLPAVVSVTEKIAEPRVPNFRGIMSARKKPKTALSASDLALEGTPVGLDGSGWEITDVVPRPVREKGEVITDEGDAAATIAEFLAARQLIGK